MVHQTGSAICAPDCHGGASIKAQRSKYLECLFVTEHQGNQNDLWVHCSKLGRVQRGLVCLVFTFNVLVKSSYRLSYRNVNKMNTLAIWCTFVYLNFEEYFMTFSSYFWLWVELSNKKTTHFQMVYSPGFGYGPCCLVVANYIVGWRSF